MNKKSYDFSSHSVHLPVQKNLEKYRQHRKGSSVGLQGREVKNERGQSLPWRVYELHGIFTWWKIHHVHGIYHDKRGFSIVMLVYRSVVYKMDDSWIKCRFTYIWFLIFVTSCWWFRNPAFTSWYGKFFHYLRRVLAASQLELDFWTIKPSTYWNRSQVEGKLEINP